MPPEHDWTPIRGGGAAGAHAATHENGGADELNLAALAGLLADDQHVLDAEVLAVAAALVHAHDEIRDADSDTGWEAEQGADEDKLRGRTKGVECALYSDLGILTLAKQSGARAYQGASQIVMNSFLLQVLLDTKDFDVQNELDVTVKTGTASATSANHLIDATLSPFTPADVGAWIWNTSDNTYAIVTAYNSTSDLTLDTDIMVNGEGYKLYRSKFTAKEPGYYSVTGNITYTSPVADKRAFIVFAKNGIRFQNVGYHTSHVATYYMCAADKVYLAANDYVTMQTFHDMGGVEQLGANSYYTNLAIAKAA